MELIFLFMDNPASMIHSSPQGMPLGARLAELTRLKLEYDAAKGQLKALQHHLAGLEDRLAPEELLADKDALTLIQEKEQLLRELRASRAHARDPAQVG